MTKSTRRRKSTSRRSALKAAAVGCGMMSTHVSVMSTLLNLQATKAMAAGPDVTDYKALVCVFLLGGNDSYNMLVPRGSEYADYSTARGGYDDGTPTSPNPGGLALLESDLLAIDNPLNDSSRSFGLHPGMGFEADDGVGGGGDLGLGGGVAKLYDDHKLSFVTNIGSLIEPTTRTDYNNRTDLPLGLFSHADLQRHWMTGAPHTRSQITGWGGRMSDLFQATNENDFVSMNISLSGSNIYQTGGSVVPYAISSANASGTFAGGATQLTEYYPTSSNVQKRIFSKQMDSVLAQTYSDLLAKSFAATHRGAADAAIEFNLNVNSIELETPFEQGDRLSRQMEMIAKVIGASSDLGQKRQVFFVTIGGWDNHANLITAHDVNFPRVSRALKSFYDATVELECENDVVTFTASDFARTLGTNGQGSDHAWGGNHIVMGGAIDGGKIFGNYPTSLSTPLHDFSAVGGGTAENLNLGRGRLIPTTSVDELAAELAMWFGVDSATDLKDILPNIEQFYNYNASTAPIGFLL